MHKLLQGLLLFFLSVSNIDASPATIQLLDGTLLRGEITAYTRGVYSFNSSTLGSLQVPETQINSIKYESAQSVPGSATQPIVSSGDKTSAQIQSIQGNLVQNKGLFSMIQALQHDPQVRAILADPEIMQAIATGDTQWLLSNHAFMKLLEHPGIRKITKSAIGSP